MSKKTTKKTEPKRTSPRPRRRQGNESPAPERERDRVNAATAPSLDQIRDRAFQIFRAGVNPRDPVADWLQAERELSGEARA